MRGSATNKDHEALEGIRVLEIGSSVASAYCGKIFADFGAHVVKVEPLTGDPLRRGLAPLLTAGDGQVSSGTFAWLNTNKLGVTADSDGPGYADRIRALAAEADVVVDGRTPAQRDCAPFALSDLRNFTDDLVVVALSAFGESGPYRNLLSTEGVCRALAGALAGVGPVEGPPFIANDGQAGVMTGVSAFIAAAAGLYGRGQGARRFTASMHETLVHMAGMDTATAMINGRARKRHGVNRFGQTHPSSIYEAHDGWIGLTTHTPDQWRTICDLIGRPDLATDERFATAASRVKFADELDEVFAPLLKARTAQEWFDLGRARRLAFAIVPSMKALLEQQVHRDRGAFGTVRTAGLAFEAPVLPFRLMRTPPAPGGTAPGCGEHDAEHPPTTAPIPPSPKAPAPSARPLDGVRIVDLTMGWAGPMATRLLADLGADVIKVEATTYPDWWRGFERSDRWFREKFYEKSPTFNSMNTGKRDVTLDLATEDGTRLLKTLVAGAHGVIENYAADVLPRLGLDYAALREHNPSLVMVSMPAFQSQGLWSDCRAYGTTLEQASGLPSISGREDGPPTMSQYAYADPYGGLNAAAAMLLGLLHRQRTGEGQFVEMAHVGGMLALAAPGIIEQSATGGLGPRLGGRHPFHVPHGAFPCRGEDQWMVIAVTDDDQWRALCDAIQRPDLADIADRRACEDRLEAAIAAWTRGQTAVDAMNRLQAAGVPCGKVLTSADVVRDEHLAARGFWQSVPREFVGTTTVPSAPFREDDRPYPVRSAAPTLGQHNADVLGGELGLTEHELRDLQAKGVIGWEVTPSRKAPQ